MRPVMRPQPGQARARQHPADRPLPGCARKPQASIVNVRNDGAVNNGANTASSVISDAGTGSTASGSISGNPFRQRHRGTAGGTAPAIMESVPQTPDQQTRNAVTRRIIAHVTAGWPRLGEPLIRHRGQYCYVAALLPGRPSPPDPAPALPGLRRPLGHRDLQGQHRPVQRNRTARLVRPRHRHARTRDRRHLHPLRRPLNRDLTSITVTPEHGHTAKVRKSSLQQSREIPHRI